jgi:uncharacterized protein (DUF2141 family)
MKIAASRRWLTAGLAVAGLAAGLAVATPAAAQYRQIIPNDMRKCSGQGPAVRVNVAGVKSSSGTMRVQLYHATKQDWLESGRWLYRTEAPAKAGNMSFCMPVPGTGSYAIAIRHDVNGNGDTDIFSDGGAMSNNPSVNIFNLGRPSVKKTAFAVGNEVKTINLQMKYM